MRPFVSIILVNYNSSDYTLPCIQSIRSKTKGVDYEIVVVDNNSISIEREKLRPVAEDTNLKFVQSEVNLGFSGGNMLGVQAARPDADYYFLLNNDTILLNTLPVRWSAVPDRTAGVSAESRSPVTSRGTSGFE